MAYQPWDLGNGITEIRVVNGGTVHIVHRDDGKYIVREDAEPQEFDTYGEALDCARRIGNDPDL